MCRPITQAINSLTVLPLTKPHSHNNTRMVLRSYISDDDCVLQELLFVKPKKVLVRVNEFIDGLRSETQ